MTISKQIAVLFVAVLLLAHGLTTADSHPLNLPGNVAELEEAISHDPVTIHAAHGGHQCRETGCTIAASQAPCAVLPMILPGLPQAKPLVTICCFRRQPEHRLVDASAAPPVPPPKSPVFETTGAFVA